MTITCGLRCRLKCGEISPLRRQEVGERSAYLRTKTTTHSLWGRRSEIQGASLKLSFRSEGETMVLSVKEGDFKENTR